MNNAVKFQDEFKHEENLFEQDTLDLFGNF